MTVLIFVILSIVLSNSFGQSPNKVVNSNLNLSLNVNVINDSIKEFRKDFETYKNLIKAEYDGKIDAINQENDGRFQVLGICFTAFITLLIVFLGLARLDTKEKIESGIVIAFDDKFERSKKKIDAIYDESVQLLEKIKEKESTTRLPKEQITEDALIEFKKEMVEKIKEKQKEIEKLKQQEIESLIKSINKNKET